MRKIWKNVDLNKNKYKFKELVVKINIKNIYIFLRFFYKILDHLKLKLF